jgi:hypothetical protein
MLLLLLLLLLLAAAACFLLLPPLLMIETCYCCRIQLFSDCHGHLTIKIFLTTITCSIFECAT